jgi:hypothetical protein
MERALVLFALIMQARGEGDRWRWKEFFTFQPTFRPPNQSMKYLICFKPIVLIKIYHLNIFYNGTIFSSSALY